MTALKKLSLEELMGLEVTSVSKRPEKLSETASAIQVITNEDIRRSGATSLAEALRLATNLQVAQLDSRQWAISARGFNNSSANKLLVLMDGRTLYSPLHAAVFWDVQDTLLEDVDRIEVISGPGATQWGANAVNGVINITTKSAKDTQGLLVEGGGGSAPTGFGGVRYGGTLAPGVHYRIYGKYFDRARTQFSNGRSGANDWRMSQGGFRVDWDAAADNHLTLQGDVYDGHLGQPGAADVDVSGGNLLGRWSRTLSDKSNLSLQWYYDRTHRRIPGTFAEDLGTYDIDFQHRFPLGDRHDLIWGAGYRLIDDQQHNDYPVLAFLPAHVRRESFNVFVQDEITLVKDRLHLTLGTKLEHNFYTGFESQPSARLSWLASKEQTVWAAVSRAVRTPSRIDGEFYAPRDPPFTLLQGNPNFVSEELLAYEFGWRVQPSPRLSLALAAFYHDYDKLRSTERVNPAAPFPLFLGNGQAGSATGAELTADYRVTDRWRLRAGYTQLHLDLRNKPGSTAPAPTDTDPEHQFSVCSSLDLPGHCEFDAAYRFVARLTAARVPAYDEVDARLGWTPTPSLEISVVGQNLLHAQHAEFNTATARQELARGVYGKITWRY
ncbi:MAG TPA: TonB-dependent receptor [Lacunisphaera sp.]|nr:TonB-dependent receptor [Lacunisphaera sp.]